MIIRILFALLCLISVAIHAQTPVIFTNELRLNPNALTPTTNGSINYLLSTHKIQARINGATTNLATEAFTDGAYWKLTGSSTLSSPTLTGFFTLLSTFTQSSGTTALNNIAITPTLNTTGTYAGFIRGIHYNPTVTSITGATHLAFHSTSGNVLLANSTSDVINTLTKLEVRALGSGSGSSGFRVIAANGNGIFRVRDDGLIAIGDQGPSVVATNGGVASNVGRNIAILAGSEGQVGDKLTLGGGNIATNSGSTRFGVVRIVGSVIPTAGSAPHAILAMENTINQTGGANGTTHGIYYNPTLTSVVGTHVAFENTSGQLRFGALTNDDTKTRILAVDNTTGQVFYRNATSLPSFGASGTIPFTNATTDNFSYDTDNKFVSATNIFTTGQNLTISQTGGTIDHATILGLDHTITNNGGQIRWSTILGENNKISSTSSTGHIANGTLVGGNTNEIKNNGTFAIFNPTIFGAALSTIDVTTATAAVNSPFMICRRCESTGDISYSYTFGHWTKTTGFGSIAMGISTTTSDTPAHEKVTSSGRHAVNISANSNSQTSGHGALADYSVILGGFDHNIPSTSNNSVILGGSGIKARSGETDQVYVPNLNIVSSPTSTTTVTDVLVRDGSVTNGQVKTRTIPLMRAGRVTTGSIAATSSAVVTLTWSATLTDTNYTCTCSVEDATAATASLSVVHIEAKTATTVDVRIENSSGGSITGTLACIAIHD